MDLLHHLAELRRFMEEDDDCSDEIGYDPDPNADANRIWDQR